MLTSGTACGAPTTKICHTSYMNLLDVMIETKHASVFSVDDEYPVLRTRGSE